MIYNSECKDCFFHATAEFICMAGRGVTPAKILVVGDSPGVQDDNRGIPFSGKSGQLVLDLLEEAGLDTDKMFFTNAVKCRAPTDTTPSQKEIKACKKYLEQEIQEIEPKYVLLMGSVALKSVLKKAKIADFRGRVMEVSGVKYLTTYHPAIALRDPKKMGPLREDVKKLAEIVKGKKKRKPSLNLRLVEDWSTVEEMLENLRNESDISYDTETTGLDPHAPGSDIWLAGFGTSKHQWIIPLGDTCSFQRWEQHDLMTQAATALAGKEVIMQNGKFDLLWTSHKQSTEMPLTFDTMLAAHLCDENDQTGLKYLARAKLGGHDYDIGLDKKTGGGLEESIEYLGYDLHYTRELKFYYEKIMLEDESLMTLFRTLVMRTVLAYTQIEKNGVYVDIEALEKADIELSSKRTVLERRLSKLAGSEINWNSTQQVNRVFFEDLKLEPVGYTPKGEPSTAEGSLLRMKKQHSIVAKLLEYRGVEKLKSGFIDGWKKRLKNECYLFPSFKMNGTVTGRPSCSDPNLQQTPRVKMIRSMISAPDDWIHFEADYSQVELRVAAMVANERTMLQIFQTGGDIHRATASAVSGVAEEDISGEDRKKAKAVNFGFIYGMGWKKFIDYAFEKYDVTLTASESQSFRRNFFDKYYDLENWHDRQRKIVSVAGQVRTMTGRIRHLPEIFSSDQKLRAQAERNAINSPVQGFAAELTLMALCEINESYSTEILRLAGTVHDALVGRVKRTAAKRVLRGIRKIMIHPSMLDELNIELTVPIEVDVKTGPWGSGVTFTD